MKPNVFGTLRYGKADVNKRWVERTIEKWTKTKGKETPKKKPGRRKKTTSAQRRALFRCHVHLVQRSKSPPYLLRAVKKDSDLSAGAAAKQLNLPIGRSTAQNILRGLGLYGRKPAKKPFVSPANLAKRRAWVKKYQGYDFTQVVFSDEKIWRPHMKNKRWVWRPIGARYHHKYCVTRKQGGGGSLHVWGAIGKDCTYPLIRVEGKLDAEAYVALLKKFFNQALGAKKRATVPKVPFVFMQDGAPSHRAKLTLNFLKRKHVEVLDWPATSPDLNPIENLWAYLSKEVYKKGNFANVEDLFEALQKEWAALNPQILANLYASMDARLDLVQEAKGYPIRF